MMSQSRDVFLDLADCIAASARSISATFQASGTRVPSSVEDRINHWPTETTAARHDLLQATEKLQQLATDPLDMLMGKIVSIVYSYAESVH